MTENKKGIQFTWVTGGSKAGVYYCNGDNNGNNFSAREEVSGANSRHSQVTTIADDDIVMVWDDNTSQENTSTSRIGIEIRKADGTQPVKQYITAETRSATFPVIENMSKNRVLVAYTESVNDRNYVRYKVVGL